MASAVLAHMLAVGFELLVDGKLAPLAFRPKLSTKQSATAPTTIGGHETDDAAVSGTQIFDDVVEDTATAKFASVLAVLARQAHVIGNGSPNEYLSASYFPSFSCVYFII
jgi:peroxin-3